MPAVAELITFPDVEEVVRGFLADVLDLADVSAGTTPKTFPARSVSIRRTGGLARDLIVDAAIVSIDCRAEASETEAVCLARDVRAYLGAAERDGVMGATPVYEVLEISAPYLNPDPLNPSQHRYTAIYQVAVRGSVT